MRQSSEQRAAEARVQVGNALADAIADPLIRERVAAIVDHYASCRERCGEVRVWRKALDTQARQRPAASEPMPG